MKKVYIIIAVIFILYAGIMCILFAKKKNTFKEAYIVTDADVLKYEKENWVSVTYNNKMLSKIPFSVYTNNQYQGKYYISRYNDKWYFFDENNTSYNLEGNLLALNEGLDVEIVNFDVNQVTLVEANEILKEKNVVIQSLDELTVNQKVEYDIDNDGENEILFCLSNLSLNIASPDATIFSLVAYQDKGKINMVIENIGSVQNNKISYFYKITNILDLNGDKKYELLIRKEKLMNSGKHCDELYELSRKKFRALKSC